MLSTNTQMYVLRKCITKNQDDESCLGKPWFRNGLRHMIIGGQHPWWSESWWRWKWNNECLRVFRTQVVETTVCATGGVHIPPAARTVFFVPLTYSACTVAHFQVWAHHTWLKGMLMKKSVCLFCACHKSPHLAFLSGVSPVLICSVSTLSSWST